MESLKKIRTAQKAAYTKAYRKVEEMISQTEINIKEVKSELKLFLAKAERLDATHVAILSEITESEFETEYEIIEEYRDKALKMEIKVNELIGDILSKTPNLSRDSDLNINRTSNSNENFHNSDLNTRKFKLPKLELRKFDGDIKEWLFFWSQFEKIDNDTDIANSDKFQYLLQATVEGSRAREVIESFPPTGENYPKAVECLKSRFGRNDLLVEVYIRELLKLVLNNVTSHSYSNNLSVLYDSLESQIRALETLGVTTDKSSALLYPLVESCMPEEFLRAWQRSPHIDHAADSKVRLESLLTFLKTEVESEERINLAMTGFGLKDELVYSRKRIKPSQVSSATSLVNFNEHGDKLCVFCNGHHDCINCYKAQKMSIIDKQKILKENGRCFKCLKVGHRANKCRHFIKCLICNKNHPSIMCQETVLSKSKVKNPPENKRLKDNKSENPSVNLASFSCSPKVLLQTLKVYLVGKNEKLCVRALFDTGSQKSYIRKEIVKILNFIPSQQQTLSHSLFSGRKIDEKNHNVYKINLESIDGNFLCNFDVFDEDIICNDVPSVKNGPWIEELKAMKITINDIEDSSGPIDLLIGADVSGRLFTGKRKVLSSGLVALETFLGWTLIGKTELPYTREDTAMTIISMFVSEATITDLFRLDVLGITDPSENKTKKEKELLIKQFFENTVRINQEGRYEVTLPWKEDHLPLSTNKELALKRLETATKKLESQNLFKVYDEIFNEWTSLEIIEEVMTYENVSHEHYLPHRPVIKEHGTTKVRPVFDASAKEAGSPSLNQCLETGPNLLELIPNLLLRFREHKYGIIADIEKAFLQISIRPEDRNYLKFLWWTNKEKDSLKVMRHARVVFGVNCSPFLLEAVLKHHLEKELKSSKYDQEIINILLRNFYVDNLVTSVDDKCKILPFIKEAHHILAEGKFNLRGWQYTGDDDPNKITPVLGMQWNREEDNLQVNLDWLKNYNLNVISKRIILSITNKIFDPVGILCPVLLLPKLLLQRMWKDKISWDSEVNEDIKKHFLNWFSELHLLRQVTVPRYFSSDWNSNENISIHTFCDASKLSYAAAVFIRVENAEKITVHLLAAKLRVAPVRNLTIPRLELLAASIGARLYASVIEGLGWKNINQQFWTDSTTVLYWIQQKESWTVFVNNRVQEIRKLSNPDSWRHLPGTCNPADLLSRGCSAKQFLDTKWWEGPTWLKEKEENWPSTEKEFHEKSIFQERRKTSPSPVSELVISSLNQSTSNRNIEGRYNESTWYYYYFSNYDKMLRMIAWIMRFIFNCKNRGSSKRIGELSYEEVRKAEIKVVKMIQTQYFSLEENKKKLKSLASYVDNDGLLRLKTKIIYRKDSEDFRSPIILPSKHLVVERLIMTEHQKNSHVGSQILMNILREHYWILNARKTIRSMISKCVICLRYAKRNLNAPTAPLPENRIKDSSVFDIIGFDMAGPLYLRGENKAWICIYTCAVYRAVHFELLSSLSTETFLQSFRRFISRRGRPSIVYCDNGTNFIGAANHLKLVDWDKIVQYSTTKKISWYFNPPTAPWWGGFWERLIGIMKQILRRVLGKALLSYEEMTTVLCDVEALINSRPLTHVSERDGDLMPLSPNSFLQDFRKNSVADFDQADEQVLNKRLKYRQKLMSDIRQRFRSEYLGLLIQKKDKKFEHQIKLGDIVLIGRDNLKCIEWPLGKIIELLPGKDNITRLVRLKTTNGELLRPIQRIFPLEVSYDWSIDRKDKKVSKDPNNGLKKK